MGHAVVGLIVLTLILSLGAHGEAMRRDSTWMDQTYNVLTWNICWGCMVANEKDVTGMQKSLKTRCSAKSESYKGEAITPCAKNIGESIAMFHRSTAGGYDLVALQEAKGSDDLHVLERGVNLQSIKYSEETFALVSMYNQNRVGRHNAIVQGTFESDSERPFLVLVFDSARLVFINMVNCHPNGGANKSWKKWAEEIHRHVARKFQAMPKRWEYRVIVAGDFNDLDGKLPGTIELPWLGSTLQLRRPYPLSCCQTKLGRDVPSTGDYIFDTAAIVRARIPKAYNDSLPMSDHRPVEAKCGRAELTPPWAYKRGSQSVGSARIVPRSSQQSMKLQTPPRSRQPSAYSFGTK